MTKQEPKLGRTLADFSAEYNKDEIVPAKIKAGLKKLGKGKWAKEVDFIRLAGLSTTDFANFRDQFEQYVVFHPGEKKRFWAGDPETAQAMREMVQR